MVLWVSEGWSGVDPPGLGKRQPGCAYTPIPTTTCVECRQVIENHLVPGGWDMSTLRRVSPACPLFNPQTQLTINGNKLIEVVKTKFCHHRCI